jgi:hypothetical protein
MIRAPFFTLSLGLIAAGVTFGTFVYKVDAPLIWSMGYGIACYGVWLGIHSWRHMPPSHDEVPHA